MNTKDLQRVRTRLAAKSFDYLKIELEANTGLTNDYEFCPCEGDDSDCNCDGGRRYPELERRFFEGLSPAARDAIRYIRFYNDGSVDTEATMTVAVSDLALLPQYVEAMGHLAYDTDNAGLHISVMQKQVYLAGELDAVKLANFKKQIKKLLPALYFHASSNHESRELRYRRPGVYQCNSHEDSGRYSAVHIFTGGIEFRVFDPCYSKPEAILNYVSTISKCLRYYSQTVQAPTAFRTFYFNDSSYGLRRFFDSYESIKVLNATAHLIAPDGLDLEALKRERRIVSNERRLLKLQAKEAADYGEYANDMKRRVRRDLERELHHLREGRTAYSGVLELNRDGLRQWLKNRREHLLTMYVPTDRAEWAARRDNDNGDYAVTI